MGWRPRALNPLYHRSLAADAAVQPWPIETIVYAHASDERMWEGQGAAVLESDHAR